MGAKFFNNQDAMRRLDNTICRYEGKPYHVKYSHNTMIELKPVNGGGEPLVVDYTNDAFDYGFPGIGYINYDMHAYYVERISGRDQRVGLPPEMLRYVHGKMPNKLFRSKGMEEMLLNVYPTCKQALKLIKDIGHTSVAISRDYALQRDELGDLDVLYHDNEVAKYRKGEVMYNQSIKRISFFMRHFGSKFEKELTGHD